MKTPSPVGPVLRVSVGLLIAAGCYEAGRWSAQLERQAALSEEMDAVPSTSALAKERAATVAAGGPVGEASDLITPLNVRDPSALVIGPETSRCAPASSAPPPPPSGYKPRLPPKAKLREEPLPEGKLLDLMKKHADKPDEPKVY